MTVIWIALALLGVAVLLAAASAVGRAMDRYDRLMEIAREARDE